MYRPPIPTLGSCLFSFFLRRWEIQNEALYRACRAYGLGEQFLAAAQEEGTFGEWLDELPFEVWLRQPPGCSSTTCTPARGSRSRPAALARPHVLAATANAALT